MANNGTLGNVKHAATHTASFISMQFDGTEVVFTIKNNELSFQERDQLFNDGQLGKIPFLSISVYHHSSNHD